MLIEIGTIINKYQQQNEVHSGNQVLLKTKEVLNRYPAISNYGLNEAVKNGFIPVVKIGKLNYFDVRDIEKYLSSNKVVVNENEKVNKKYV
ncbi:MAG: hypothetical protein IKX00_05600 [Bacilli bacterium]|nr:hypothetical protein [Bacilli bacterium]MBR5663091.1 hypothetical protein [Bacilli bacterium]